MADTFTHDFEIKLNGETFTGEVEFNTDNKVSYHFTEDPTISLPFSLLLNQLFLTLQQIFEMNDSLDKIEVTIKEE